MVTRTPDRNTRYEAIFFGGGPLNGEKRYLPKIHDELLTLLPLSAEMFRSAIDSPGPELIDNGLARYRLAQCRGRKLFYRFVETT